MLLLLLYIIAIIFINYYYYSFLFKILFINIIYAILLCFIP